MNFFVPYFEDESTESVAQREVSSFLASLQRDVIGQQITTVHFGPVVTQLILNTGSGLCIDTQTRGPHRDESYMLAIVPEALAPGDQRLGEERLFSFRPEERAAARRQSRAAVPFWEHWWAVNASHASPLRFPGGFREDLPGREGFALLNGEVIRRVWIPKNGVQIELSGGLSLIEYVSGPNISRPCRYAIFQERRCIGVWADAA